MLIRHHSSRKAPFNQHISKLRGYLQGISNLRGKVKNNTKLLTHGLDLKNGQVAAELNEHLLHLTGNTVDDSLTVKIITVVGLIYLPADFVAVSILASILILEDNFPADESCEIDCIQDERPTA